MASLSVATRLDPGLIEGFLRTVFRVDQMFQPADPEAGEAPEPEVDAAPGLEADGALGLEAEQEEGPPLADPDEGPDVGEEGYPLSPAEGDEQASPTPRKRSRRPVPPAVPVTPGKKARRR